MEEKLLFEIDSIGYCFFCKKDTKIRLQYFETCMKSLIYCCNRNHIHKL
jgi:hypothetical protein